MTPKTQARNEAILSEVEGIGGGYVWEREIFAVTLIDIPVSDRHASVLLGLTGVEQIAINASNISAPVLNSIARIADLKSLVITGRDIDPEELSTLQSVGPAIEIVDHKA